MVLLSSYRINSARCTAKGTRSLIDMAKELTYSVDGRIGQDLRHAAARENICLRNPMAALIWVSGHAGGGRLD